VAQDVMRDAVQADAPHQERPALDQALPYLCPVPETAHGLAWRLITVT
jgi:hypothetical protein